MNRNSYVEQLYGSSFSYTLFLLYFVSYVKLIEQLLGAFMLVLLNSKLNLLFLFFQHTHRLLFEYTNHLTNTRRIYLY